MNTRPYLQEHYELEAKSILISHLGLSEDTLSVLTKAELNYLADVLQFRAIDLIRIPCIKIHHCDELLKCLDEMGLKLATGDLFYNPPALYNKTVFGHLIDDWEIYDEYHKSVIPISLLKFTARTHNCLKRSNIQRVGDILDYSRRGQLKYVRNLGNKSYREIESKLNDIGIRLPLCDSTDTEEMHNNSTNNDDDDYDFNEDDYL